MLLLALLVLPVAPTFAGTGPTLDVKFSGVIDVVPAAAGEPWQVAGYSLAVNEATNVRLTKGPAAAGMWADVTAQRLADNSLLATNIVVRSPEVRLRGPLSDKPEDGIGAWTVAGQTIWCTEDTSINQRSGPVEVGQWVEVHAVEEPEGTLTAVRIRGIEAAEDAVVYGAIQSFGSALWMLSSIPVAVTADTLILGEPRNGLLATAAADLTDTGLSARVFKVAWQEPKGQRQPVHLVGLIEEMPENGLIGLWQVAGQTVEVRESTLIVQVKGLAQVGARVYVIGLQSADRILATNVIVLSSPSGSGRTFNLRGNIEALPESGLRGTWTIAGLQAEVTRQTRIHGEQHVRLGAPVEAGGIQYQNGVRQMTWLRVRDMSGPGPQPTVTPGPTQVPLSVAEKDALQDAIDEEYLARDTYEFVLDKLGADVTPFNRIALSEQQHVDALSALFEEYSLTTPGDAGLAADPIFTDRAEACQIGVDAEKRDIALYDELLASDNIKHADMIQVFTNLRAASLNDHLPAFEQCN
jgi:hypothetical protein